ncbi:MAG: hypothetical protein UX13_C0033G0006 [Candidatus Woesebacteria bacterium GW2011_GWB1_45_5]|uniref:Uncharacterized protein n=1 Tax=Candidatus Woesebacteria bacterium GW2011_GWB1_45_5 TaxID=1618581 RepID=A0A0G1MMY4_9BACT|nr:MAG: hypothetical protein UX13_C0033G0006 [Candidatus Woesebacteria bacterium GW2011_GWB1_45_5]
MAESDFIETKEQILARTPFLKAHLDFDLFPDSDAWGEKTESEYEKILKAQQEAFGSSFNQLGPMSVYMMADIVNKVFSPKLPDHFKLNWAYRLTAFGWEIGAAQQVMQLRPEILSVFVDFKVFDESRFDDPEYFDRACLFLDTGAMLGAHWRTLAEKTPREFEDFISKMNIDLGDEKTE